MDKKSARIRRAARARHMMREQGVTRLVIHRTPRHIYAQVIAPNGSEAVSYTHLDVYKRQIWYIANNFSYCRVSYDSNGELFVMEKFTLSNNSILSGKRTHDLFT